MSPTASRLLDTSAWLSYYFGESQKTRAMLESDEELAASIVSIYEIERKLAKLKYREEEIREFVEYLKNRACVLPISPEICSSAARLSINHRLGAMDSLILACAQSDNMTLVTGDLDFKGLKKIELIL